MSCKLPLFSFFLLILLIIPASAQTVSLSDIHLIDNQKIDVYEINGSESVYIGEFNSTDSITLNPNSNYQFILKPGPTDWFMETKTTMIYMTTTEGGQFLNALMFFAVFGGGFIFIASRLWNR